MANSKISALTSASTPLTGSEIVPIDQSGITNKVTVANLTTGRAVSALSLTLTNPLATSYGGTGLTSFTANGVVYASSTSALATGSGLVFDGTNFLVGSTTAYAKFQVYQSSNAYAGFIYQQYTTSSSIFNAAMQVRNDYVTGSNTGYMIVFQNGNATYSGSITSTTSATAYNTTSDRRLKTNIVDLTNSGTVIDSLKPRAFTWIADGSSDAGFIADEFQQVLPKAVTGQPNATKEEEYEVTPAVKDDQGIITTPAVMGTRTVPDYQMIDASQPELIAYLVAEVQSLRARLKAANIA